MAHGVTDGRTALAKTRCHPGHELMLGVSRADLRSAFLPLQAERVSSCRIPPKTAAARIPPRRPDRATGKCCRQLPGSLVRRCDLWGDTCQLRASKPRPVHRLDPTRSWGPSTLGRSISRTSGNPQDVGLYPRARALTTAPGAPRHNADASGREGLDRPYERPAVRNLCPFAETACTQGLLFRGRHRFVAYVFVVFRNLPRGQSVKLSYNLFGERLDPCPDLAEWRVTLVRQLVKSPQSVVDFPISHCVFVLVTQEGTHRASDAAEEVFDILT